MTKTSILDSRIHASILLSNIMLVKYKLVTLSNYCFAITYYCEGLSFTPGKLHNVLEAMNTVCQLHTYVQITL